MFSAVMAKPTGRSITLIWTVSRGHLPFTTRSSSRPAKFSPDACSSCRYRRSLISFSVAEQRPDDTGQLRGQRDDGNVGMGLDQKRT